MAKRGLNSKSESTLNAQNYLNCRNMQKLYYILAQFTTQKKTNKKTKKRSQPPPPQKKKNY